MDEPTFLQLAEAAGVWTAYWNLDFREAAPTKYVTNYDLSAFGPFYTEQCQAVLDGTWSGAQRGRAARHATRGMGRRGTAGRQDAVAEVTAKPAWATWWCTPAR